MTMALNDACRVIHLNARLDLRVRRGVEDEVRDIAYDGFVVVPGGGGQLLPLGVGAEEFPFGFEVGGVGEAEHVGEVGHARTDKSVGVEDCAAACSLEYLEL